MHEPGGIPLLTTLKSQILTDFGRLQSQSAPIFSGGWCPDGTKFDRATRPSCAGHDAVALIRFPQVPRHLRNIEKWFDDIPERFRDNVRAARLGKFLKDNV